MPFKSPTKRDEYQKKYRDAHRKQKRKYNAEYYAGNKLYWSSRYLVSAPTP